MPVTLASASDARLDFGDLSDIAGRGTLTIAITLRPNASPSGRIYTQWAAAGGNQCILTQITDTDEFAVLLAGGGVFKGRKTTALNMASGTTYGIVVRWLGSGFGDTMVIYVNGTTPSQTTFFSDGAVSSVNDSANAFQIGHETAESVDGVDGDYSEFAMWDGAVPVEICQSISAGFSPKFFRNCGATGMFYAPLENTSNLVEMWRNKTITNSSGTDGTTSGQVFQPRSAGTWARGSAAAATKSDWLRLALQGA